MGFGAVVDLTVAVMGAPSGCECLCLVYDVRLDVSAVANDSGLRIMAPMTLPITHDSGVFSVVLMTVAGCRIVLGGGMMATCVSICFRSMEATSLIDALLELYEHSLQ
ncbi:unnamed protein product [Meganyctiphanes norvegica]|uniref:Uncharacterized protein n=1 Tax=Meganyctiphanes norvegica TaxID=48144 RepID=A0AAV2PZY9_MEGNR